jgi:hypothetical protein
VLACRRRWKQYPASRHISTNTIVIVTPMPAAAPADSPPLALRDVEPVEGVVPVAVLAEEAEVVDMVAPRIRNWADSAISLLPRWIGWLVS